MTAAIPQGALVFPLQRGQKLPLRGSNGHHDAVPPEQFDFSLVPQFVNYGISLDGQYLLVDFDQDVRAEPFWQRLPPTRIHGTRRGGWHYIYEYYGEGKNVDLPGVNVKIHGYAVGPGSCVEGGYYTVLDPRVPAPAPQWLRDLVEIGNNTPALSGDTELGGVPAGSHDKFLHSLASWLRGRYGLSEEAIEEVLRNGPLEALQDTRDEEPYTDADLHRIAHSAASYMAEAPDLVSTTTLRSGAEVPTVPPRMEWVLPGFVPDKALTILYGDGKIGKSSFASWLAARETLKGGKVIFIPSGEETFDLFVQRARLNGAVDGLLYEFANAKFDLSTGWPTLQAAIQQLEGVTLVYIDALYSHFGAGPVGENEAVRARTRLSPLARVAEAEGVAILGTIHENKGGGSLGSAEMRNVARSFIHAKGGRGKDFTIWADGSNGWSPEYGVSFKGTAHPVVDHETGEQLFFDDLFGERILQSIWVLEQGEKVYPTPHSVGVDEIDESKHDVMSYKREHPNATQREISEATGVSQSTVHRYLKS